VTVSILERSTFWAAPFTSCSSIGNVEQDEAAASEMWNMMKQQHRKCGT